MTGAHPTTSSMIQLLGWTRSEKKVSAYAEDHEFVASAELFRSVPDLPRYAMCVLKPEAAAGRRMRRVLDLLENADFRPAFAARFRYDSATLRRAWHYQLNIATPERAAAMEVVLTSSPSLLLVLRDTKWATGSHPATVRLTSLKGPADPKLRRPEDLRHQLGVVNGLFNFLHTADEPIDLVRETAILLGLDTCHDIRRAMLEGCDARAAAAGLADSIESGLPAHELDYDASRERLRHHTGRDTVVVDAAAAIAASDYPALEDVLTILAASNAQEDPMVLWDVLTLVSARIECNRAGVAPTIPTIGPADYAMTAKGQP